MKAKDYFTLEEQKRITDAVEQAEKNTSGEIRVHVENECRIDVLDRAVQIFAMLKMHKTKLRNGVLIYLSLKDHKFAILGDAGINAKVPEDFWDSTKQAMLEEFQENRLTEGIIKGITMAGEKLKEHFPYKQDDVDELTNDISFG
ncbi:MAG TPA: TPM domain-containing protein [Tenuifilaceae bacterium]|nr:TPM domain-containing protein [Bacteroidales bacterium]HOC36947.1 TPM domain-containing protein [Tenuifilaceae bacterium]HOG72706.1 TPM domain-containing protein [Tenuifilaceae bacterium]HOY72588.1 TPM domain-containing protein [Tenuifilaceae bacterium]HPG99747.1 TPM domain-containing protein [Tenuifilaceae bacterium]